MILIEIDGDEYPTEFVLHYDERHSWLEVPLLWLYIMAIDVKEFTKYSYVGEHSVFLEEDVDFGYFMVRFKDFSGQDIPFSSEVNHGQTADSIRALPKIEGGRSIH